MPESTITISFTAFVKRLQTYCTELASGIDGDSEFSPSWFILEGEEGKFDFDKMRELINSDEAATEYVNNQHEPMVRSMLAKIQSDFLSAARRDVIMRKRSRIRMMAHATQILNVAGDDEGVINSGIYADVNKMMLRANQAGEQSNSDTEEE